MQYNSEGYSFNVSHDITETTMAYCGNYANLWF